MSSKKSASIQDKLKAKQERRRMKTGLLPNPELDISVEDYTSFAACLRSSNTILALLGAGLSAASGIPTFRGAGGYWRSYDATELATPEAFGKNPSTVWQFYHHRRLVSLNSSPNRAHFALAELARRRGEDFLAISQNIDGLSERANHAESSLQRVHGSLHKIKCSSKDCDFRQDIDSTTELCGALPLGVDTKLFTDPEVSIPTIPTNALPTCPQCQKLLRPNVVWFGEPIETASRDRIHDWLDARPKVDLMLVIGTSAVVYPAAAYIHSARVQGARVAVFNTEEPSEEDQNNPVTSLRDGMDWFFKGSADETLPDLLKEVIGKTTAIVD